MQFRSILLLRATPSNSEEVVALWDRLIFRDAFFRSERKQKGRRKLQRLTT